MKKYNRTTTDIYLAAALLAVGAKLVNVDYSDQRHIKFTLETDNDISILERDFDNGELVGDLSSYADNLRKIKNKLYLESI